MKITKQITALLMDGKPRSAQDLCEALGLTAVQVKTAMSSLHKHSHIVRTPITYRLTESGERHATKPASRTEQARIVHNLKQANRRERAKEEAAARTDPDAMVNRALSSRPALQMAWGAGA
ncbi:MAG: hypothetical protein EOP24_26220 [Hyphomicrobiales bacterium]|nr:MAG: hypothetical protein EOP24_26220 [Hyphomicrobiales bacterium]